MAITGRHGSMQRLGTTTHLDNTLLHVFVCAYLAVEQLWGHTAEHHQGVFLYRPVNSLSGHPLQSSVVSLVVGRQALLGLFTAKNKQTICQWSLVFSPSVKCVIFLSSRCTFLLLAWGLDDLLFTSLPFLSLSSDHLLVSGSRLNTHLIINIWEQETLSVASFSIILCSPFISKRVC